MARAKKNGHTLNCIVREPEYKGLQKFSEVTGFTKTKIVEKALKQFIENYSFTDKNGNKIAPMDLETFLSSDLKDVN